MSLITSIRRDINAVFEHDPAANSTLEVLLAYPGFHARQFHRLAHTVGEKLEGLERRMAELEQRLDVMEGTKR